MSREATGDNNKTDEMTAGLIIQTDSKADAVTVYNTQMQVRRVAEVALPATVNASSNRRAGDAESNEGNDVLQLLFAMPPQFDRDSVQVRFDEKTAAQVVLRAVLFEEKTDDADDHTEKDEEGKKKSVEKEKELKAQIREVTRKIEHNKLEQNAVKKESELNARLFSRVCGPVTDRLPTVLDINFWEEQLIEVKNSTTDANTKRRRLQKEGAELEAELNRLNEMLYEIRYTSGSIRANDPSSTKKTFACIVLVVKNALPRAVVYVTYMSPGASWRPDYEVALNSQEQILTLRYNAAVCAGGEELNDVLLTLSSAAPRRSTAEPKLEPWRLEEAGNDVHYGVSCEPMDDEAPMNDEAPMDDEAPARPDSMSFSGVAMNIQTAGVSESVGLVNFTVPSRHTLKAGGTELRVPLTVLDWNADVSYVTVPSVTESVFAKAVCTNESEYQLLPGAATIILNGDFVTNASLQRTAPGEKLEVHFGVDATVQVKRQLVQRLTTNVKSSMFNRESKQRILFEYMTTLTNKKQKESVTVTLKEHIPKSNEEKLTVKLLEPKDYDSTGDKAQQQLLESDGLLEIKMTLEPNETLRLPFSFEVEPPMDARIYGL